MRATFNFQRAADLADRVLGHPPMIFSENELVSHGFQSEREGAERGRAEAEKELAALRAEVEGLKRRLALVPSQ